MVVDIFCLGSTKIQFVNILSNIFWTFCFFRFDWKELVEGSSWIDFFLLTIDTDIISVFFSFYRTLTFYSTTCQKHNKNEFINTIWVKWLLNVRVSYLMYRI